MHGTPLPTFAAFVCLLAALVPKQQSLHGWVWIDEDIYIHTHMFMYACTYAKYM